MGGEKYLISGWVDEIDNRENFEVSNLFQLLKAYFKLKKLSAKYITLFIRF